MVSLRERFFRTKNIPSGHLDTQLRRCLSTTDITLLGIGHMIGAGIYVLTGTVIKNIAGPSVVLSFLLAGVAALMSALCYAEFGARFPKAGSAYTYAYVGCGELWAFIIGWNIILEHMLASAAVARSWSGYLDSLTSNRISNYTIAEIGELGQQWKRVEMLSPKRGSLFGLYPDLVAVLVVLVTGSFVAAGSKAATNFNSFFTVINLLVIVFVIGYGITFADFSNWTGGDEEHSRFLPYGWNGMLGGAASCFFAYIGFDGLATAGEEAKDPSRSIPHATYLSMGIVTLAYILMSGTLSLMVPYYAVHPTAAFADAFDIHGATMAKYIVSVGALAGMTTSLVGGMFSLPRCLYAMAEDGLVFSFWGKVYGRTQTPMVAVVCCTAMTAVIACIFDVEALVEFLSIGTLLAYSIVSACVIILRYQPAPTVDDPSCMDQGGRLRVRLPWISSCVDCMETGYSVYYGVAAMIVSFTAFGVLLSSGALHSGVGAVFLGISTVVSVFSVIFIALHHQNTTPLAFKVFWVPFLPALSLLMNILMMTHLSPLTWIRLVVWMTIGMCIYLLYGMSHSKEENKGEKLGRRSSTYDSVVIASSLSE